MNTDQVRALLGGLTGHVVSDTPQQRRDIQRLDRSISRTLLSADTSQLQERRFAFEDADLFFAERISADRSRALHALAERTAAQADEVELRMFVRDMPVLSTQLHASVPAWAAGAAIDHTVGPLIHQDGRQLWFDFLRIERLAALYIQGQPDPVLLFKLRSGLRRLDPLLPLLVNPSVTYRLPAGSIWILSRVLAANAPSGFFTGLTIRGGTITLSAAPQTTDGKLTITPDTVVTVKLQLHQPDVSDADPSSSYGVDARDAELELPANLAFHFSGQGRTLDEVAPASWNVYGHDASFQWNPQPEPTYDAALRRVLIPFACSTAMFEVGASQSPFHTLAGRATIGSSAWALPVAQIDILHPTPAAGIGAMLVRCAKGLTTTWKGLRGGTLNLNQPAVMAEPGVVSITDFVAGNVFCQQAFQLWKDEQNPFASTVQLQYPSTTPVYYASNANGNELLAILTHADVQIDRPVTATGAALAIRSKNSVLALAVSDAQRLLYLFDDNILADSTDLTRTPPVIPASIALALHNALFKVTPVNACVLFGQLSQNFATVKPASLFLTFGLQAYLPTLPDPYAANLGALKFQFRGREPRAELKSVGGRDVWLWLICRVKWEAATPTSDQVDVSFHFAPLQNPVQFAIAAAAPVDPNRLVPPSRPAVAHPLFALAGRNATSGDIAAAVRPPEEMIRDDRPDAGQIWEDRTAPYRRDLFALLDVSTNADLLGVGFAQFGGERMAMVTTHTPTVSGQGSTFPLQVQGMDVVSAGTNVRVMTVPQISWEPVVNLTERVIQGDPAKGVNYYPDDGGPTHIINNSGEQVALAPIPLTNFLVDAFERDDTFAAAALFTLPFGMRALALLQKQYQGRVGTNVRFNSKVFPHDLTGGLQLEIHAGAAPVVGQSDMFVGSTVQKRNVIDSFGGFPAPSTLGNSPTDIFNQDFFPDQTLVNERGVPLVRLDISGYGASIFSNWFNPKAPIASTSQAKFDVFVGRCAHEVVQVKSILYPWAIHVVRTITLFRAGSGYVYRYDSGWQAESDGRFDFSYYAYDGSTMPATTVEKQALYAFHPGIVTGLFNIRDITETEEIAPYTDPMTIAPNEQYVNKFGYLTLNGGSPLSLDVKLQPLYFNADVEIELPTSGHQTKTIKGTKRTVVPSKRILGFVQISPLGQPLTVDALRRLIQRQGTIGGPIDCVVNIGQSGQQMRLNRFDVNNSVAANGTDRIFVVAGRGNVVLPKDGSWSMVKHEHGSGEVSPVQKELSVPLIRSGKVVKLGDTLTLDSLPANNLLRVANPMELLRQAVNDTVNYGYLHSTDTQKALFLTPAYKLMTGAPPGEVPMLFSKTPPLFVDAFRIVNSKGIFPNIGNAVTGFGDAISLFAKGTEFTPSALTDAGKPVLELLRINNVVNNVTQEGYELLKKVEEFDLPSTGWNLIEIGSAFKIYIEYKADNIRTPGGGSKNAAGGLNFDINSFANNVAERWKSRMSNVAVVVDLGPIKRLMTIKGEWDAKKGAQAEYKGSSTDPDFPSPQIEFAPELKPVIEILEILQDLQGENYKDAFQRGLKLAMSNKAGTWEYKFDAAKEIPVLRFPMPDFLYNDPNAPLKLEAGLKLGAYFNAALKVTTEPGQLVPTAGAYLGFYGRLSVMCVSLSVATVYAVGQVNLDIAADSKTGPSLRMKFGFGAQIVVGLPVVGNVSVLYMVGVEIYTDATTVVVSAFLLFQGHAELLAGLVSVTITIEAKGTISRAGDRTDLAAQVTFGIDISIFLVINISFSTSWEEQRQIA